MFDARQNPRQPTSSNVAMRHAVKAMFAVRLSGIRVLALTIRTGTDAALSGGRRSTGIERDGGVQSAFLDVGRSLGAQLLC